MFPPLQTRWTLLFYSLVFVFFPFGQFELYPCSQTMCSGLDWMSLTLVLLFIVMPSLGLSQQSKPTSAITCEDGESPLWQRKLGLFYFIHLDQNRKQKHLWIHYLVPLVPFAAQVS